MFYVKDLGILRDTKWMAKRGYQVIMRGFSSPKISTYCGWIAHIQHKQLVLSTLLYFCILKHFLKNKKVPSISPIFHSGHVKSNFKEKTNLFNYLDLTLMCNLMSAFVESWIIYRIIYHLLLLGNFFLKSSP